MPESESKRARILEAAFALCQERGVVNARMDDVATRARVSKGTLYRFFASKEDLFLATLIESYEQSLRWVGPALEPGADPASALEKLLDGLCQVLADVGPKRGVYDQAWGVVASDGALEARLHDFLRRFHAERVREISQIIASGQQAGVFRGEPSPTAVAETIGAMLSGFIYRAPFDAEATRPDALRECFDMLVRAVLLPHAAPGEEGPR
jgi:AcrR family transcriptional regulator